MKKIKVCLQRPLFLGDSPYYDYLTKNVSPKIEYVNIAGKNQGIVKDIKKFKILNKTKRAIKLTIRNLFPGMPNAHLVRDGNYDVIHCAHCMSLNKKPWVMDVEYVNQFWAGGIPKKQKKFILRLLKSKYCKKILAWTKWTEKGILKEFPEIENKIEIIYPAIKPVNFKKIKSKNIRLLFVSRRFYFKGGLHALEVMDRLTKKYDNVEGTIISDTPKEILDRYARNKKIKFRDVMPKEELFFQIYPRTDILIYPSYTDTFGFAIIEALSFGIPVVSVAGQSRSDLIGDGKTGFIVEEPKNFQTEDLNNLNSLKNIINEIEKKVELLIKNKKLRDNMSKNCLQEFKKGKFSIKERNKKIEKIYFEAIR